MREDDLIDVTQLETAEAALEVIVLWGEESVLHVSHLAPPYSFAVGDALHETGENATNFVIGRESLGVERLPITLSREGTPVLVVPQGARGELYHAEDCIAFESLLAEGKLEPYPELEGAHVCVLPLGSTARLEHRGFTFLVRPTRALRPVGVGGMPRTDAWQRRCTLGSAALHALLLLSFYFLPPTGSALALDRLETDSRLVHFALDAIEQVDPPPTWLDDGKTHDQSPADAKRHEGPEGQAGDKSAKKNHAKMGIPGPADNPDPAVPRDRATSDLDRISIIGMLRAQQGALNTPTSPYGRAQAIGSDPEAAIGALLGDVYGSNFGWNGIGMRGTGHGGGGDIGQTAGVGDIGHDLHARIGHGYGAHASTLHDHNGVVPHRVKELPADIHGSLSKETIRRIVRRHLSEVRYCYEQRLIARPDLQGRIAVKFIIAPSGDVQAAVVASSDLGDPTVAACVVDGVRRWSFPAPEGGGIVAVTYPFMFEQSGN